jgi:hypothetical protein
MVYQTNRSTLICNALQKACYPAFCRALQHTAMNSASNILLLLILGLSGCRTKMIEPYPPTTVEVTVVDSKTGVPIPYAIVIVTAQDLKQSTIGTPSGLSSPFRGNVDINGKLKMVLRIPDNTAASVMVTPDGPATPVNPEILPRGYELTRGAVNKVLFRFKF